MSIKTWSGAALGLAGPEFCGAAQAFMSAWILNIIGAVSLTGVVFTYWMRRRIPKAGVAAEAHRPIDAGAFRHGSCESRGGCDAAYSSNR